VLCRPQEAAAERAQTKKAERQARKEAHKSRARKRGRQNASEDRAFDEQLAQFGLRVVSIRGDGNCMFRSIADQLEGDQHAHWNFRTRIVDYIRSHREDFEPFIEDDEGFDDYIQRMGSEGEWGGHQELFAASRALHMNFVIHQYDAPRFEIHVEDGQGHRGRPEDSPCVHLSYHGEQHYNSVRDMADPGSGPAWGVHGDGQGIRGQPRKDEPSSSAKTKGKAAAKAKKRAEEEQADGRGSVAQTDEERLVQLSIPSASLETIRGTLREVANNAEYAIELLVSGFVPPPSAVEEDAASGASSPSAAAGSADSPAQAPPTDAAEGKKGKVGKKKKGGDKVGRAEDCPCGSGKRYKKCCMKKDKAAKVAAAAAAARSRGMGDGSEVDKAAESLAVIVI